MYMIKTPHPVHLLLGPLPSWGVAAGAGEGGPPSLAHPNVQLPMCILPKPGAQTAQNAGR